MSAARQRMRSPDALDRLVAVEGVLLDTRIRTGEVIDTGPALVSIMSQGSNLIASIHTALDDSQMLRFQHDLIAQIGQRRSRGVIIDVAALDVLDSFGSETLRNIGEMARLRGAMTVIVGIQPEVALAMVTLGTGTGATRTALDLEEGLSCLDGIGQGQPSATIPAGTLPGLRYNSEPPPRVQACF